MTCYAEACLRLGGCRGRRRRALRRLVAADPLAERGYLLLMRALDAQGDRAAALNVFVQLQRTLRDELGVSPGPEAAALHRTLLRGTGHDGRAGVNPG